MEDSTQKKKGNFDVVGSYVATLDQAVAVQVSSIDMTDVAQVKKYSSMGVRNKQLVADTSAAYHTLSQKLDSAIKTHMNARAESFNKNTGSYATKGQTGDLVFQKPTMFITHLDTEESANQMITPSDSLLAYEFLMFRVVSGDQAYHLAPNFVVSFKENSNAMYKTSDVLKSFKYKADNEEVVAFQGAKPNPTAKALLSADKEEVKSIIQNVFGTYADACMKLQRAADDDGVRYEVCKNAHDFGDPDYTIKMFTCLDTFQLTTVPGMCSEPEYEDFDL